MRFTVVVRSRGARRSGRFYVAYEGPVREEATLVARMCVNTINAVLGSGTVTLEAPGMQSKRPIRHTWTLTKGLISEDEGEPKE